jgi:hypothetical protein
MAVANSASAARAKNNFGIWFPLSEITAGIGRRDALAYS